MGKKQGGKKGRKGKLLSFTVPYMFGTRRVTVEEKTVDPRTLHAEPGKGTLPPRDERLVGLLRDVHAGKAPAVNWCVPVADLAVHDPPTVERARAKWLEEPAQAAAQVELHRRKPGRWLVYRGADGRLVMFDDYGAYTAVLDAGLEHCPVALVWIPGESAEDLARHEAAAGCRLCAAAAGGETELAEARLLARIIVHRADGPWDAGLCDFHRENVLREGKEGK